MKLFIIIFFFVGFLLLTAAAVDALPEFGQLNESGRSNKERVFVRSFIKIYNLYLCWVGRGNNLGEIPQPMLVSINICTNNNNSKTGFASSFETAISIKLSPPGTTVSRCQFYPNNYCICIYIPYIHIYENLRMRVCPSVGPSICMQLARIYNMLKTKQKQQTIARQGWLFEDS